MEEIEEAEEEETQERLDLVIENIYSKNFLSYGSELLWVKMSVCLSVCRKKL